MKFRKSIIGLILAAVISVTAIAPCNVVYADTSKTASAKSNVPGNFKCKKTTTTITLSWDEVKGADGYKVYMLDNSTLKYKSYKNVKGNSCTIKGLSKKTGYMFKISVLYKKNGKYYEKENSMSKSVLIFTESSDIENDSGYKEPVIETSGVTMGDKRKTAIRKSGISNYIEDGNEVAGTVLFGNYLSVLTMKFDKNDKVYYWEIQVPNCSQKTADLIMYSFFTTMDYDDYEVSSNGGYLFISGNVGMHVYYNAEKSRMVLEFVDMAYI